jgi:hypothetical protein
MDKTKIFFLTIIFCGFFGLAENSLAAPSVSAVVGTVSHNSTVTINGSGFGTKSTVAPFFWDSVGNQPAYNGLTNGTQLFSNSTGDALNGSYPWQGNGSSVTACGAAYSTTNLRHSHVTAQYSNRWSMCGGNGSPGVVGGLDMSSRTSHKMYITWWIYFSGSSDNGGSNKYLRMTANGIDWSHATVSWEPDKVQGYNFDTGNYTINADSNTPGAGWHRFEAYFDNTTSPDPTVTVSSDNSVLLSVKSGDSVNYGAVTGNLPTNMMGIYALGADWSNAQPQGTCTADFGEIYVDDTLARVEICNAATKAGSNHCEIQIPQTTWNSGQVQIKVNQGSFADSSSAYIYVVDSTGAVNANGYAVTLGSSGGGGGDTAPPAAPSGLSVS